LPDVLLFHQSELGLTSEELNVTLHKARFGDLPCRVLACVGLRWYGGWRRVKNGHE
jgi:hypothetical protein